MEYIYLPKQGLTMTEGTIVKWLKEDGSYVLKEEDLFEFEYDKATAIIQSSAEGILKIIVYEGETVEVSTVVGKLFGKNEKIEDADLNTKKSSGLPTLSEQNDGISAAINATSKQSDGISAAIPKLATPIAKKIAKENNIDLTKVKGTGPSRRITKEDVQKFVGGTLIPQEVKYSSSENEVENIVAMSGMRKAISQKMCRSAFTAPHVTYTAEADMSEICGLREQLNNGFEETGIKISFNDIIVKAVAKALKKMPEINAQLDDNKIKYIREINIGIAVALDDGLIVPVINNADMHTIQGIAVIAKDLTGKAKKGFLKAEEITGGTFTVSNLGMFGINTFTPIINHPESAILGVGRIADKAVVEGKQIVAKPMMGLSLSADHRVIDGAPAAQFLLKIIQYLENPYLLFIDI